MLHTTSYKLQVLHIKTDLHILGKNTQLVADVVVLTRGLEVRVRSRGKPPRREPQCPRSRPAVWPASSRFVGWLRMRTRAVQHTGRLLELEE